MLAALMVILVFLQAYVFRSARWLCAEDALFKTGGLRPSPRHSSGLAARGKRGCCG